MQGGSVDKALEMWPALTLGFIVAGVAGVVITYLFKLILKQHQAGIEQRDAALKTIIESHEQTSKKRDESTERSLKRLGDELSEAIKKASDEQAEAVQELAKELRLGRGRVARGRST